MVRLRPLESIPYAIYKTGKSEEQLAVCLEKSLLYACR